MAKKRKKRSKQQQSKKQFRKEMRSVADDISEMSPDEIRQEHSRLRMVQAYTLMEHHFEDIEVDAADALGFVPDEEESQDKQGKIQGRAVALCATGGIAGQLQFVAVAQLELAATIIRSGVFSPRASLILAGVGPHALDDAMYLLQTGYDDIKKPSPATAGWLAWSVLGGHVMHRIGAEKFPNGWEDLVTLPDILEAAREWRKAIESIRS